MTDPRPIGDDAVSRRYREIASEEPPRALDEAILAASRRAAGARPVTPPSSARAPAGRRWAVPLAAAAVIVLAAGLTLRMQLERPVQEDLANVTPPSVAVLQAPAPKETAKAAAEEAKPQPPRAEATPQRRAAPKAAAPLARSQSDIPSPPAPAAPPETRALESQAIQRGPAAAPEVPQAFGQRADQAARDRAGEASSERAEVASGALAKRKALDEAPEKALERIAELRKAGKHDEADKALAEFRKRFPDYRLSDEMKARVERR